MDGLVISSRLRAKTIALITLGNGLEFFDFTVYAFFAPIIAKLYFLAQGTLNQLLLAFGSFGLSFIARPIGSIILGAYADRAGRKTAMNLALGLMCLGSALLAFAPTRTQWGWAAPALLITARLLQGFALGGEVGASTTLLIEYAPPAHRAFYCSWQFASQGLSALFGAGLAVLLTSTLAQSALQQWGWRVPFMLGMLIGPAALYLRRQLKETLPQGHAKLPHAPWYAPFKTHGRLLAAGTLTMAGATAATYIVIFYMAIHATELLRLPMSSSLWAPCAGSLALAIGSPLAGRLADRRGRKPVIGLSRLLLIVTIGPAFFWLNQAPSVPLLLMLVALLSLLIAYTTVPNLALITEAFPQSMRAGGSSLVYCLSVAIFGGFAPFIVTKLIQLSGSLLAPAWYLIGCGLISLLPLPFIRETRWLTLADS